MASEHQIVGPVHSSGDYGWWRSLSLCGCHVAVNDGAATDHVESRQLEIRYLRSRPRSVIRASEVAASSGRHDAQAPHRSTSQVTGRHGIAGDTSDKLTARERLCVTGAPLEAYCATRSRPNDSTWRTRTSPTSSPAPIGSRRWSSSTTTRTSTISLRISSAPATRSVGRPRRRAAQERVGVVLVVDPDVVRAAGPVAADRPTWHDAAELPSGRRSDGAAPLCRHRSGCLTLQSLLARPAAAATCLFLLLFFSLFFKLCFVSMIFVYFFSHILGGATETPS